MDKNKRIEELTDELTSLCDGLVCAFLTEDGELVRGVYGPTIITLGLMADLKKHVETNHKNALAGGYCRVEIRPKPRPATTPAATENE